MADCIHHWQIETESRGGKVAGRCQKCAASRTFPAGLNSAKGTAFQKKGESLAAKVTSATEDELVDMLRAAMEATGDAEAALNHDGGGFDAPAEFG